MDDENVKIIKRKILGSVSLQVSPPNDINRIDNEIR